MHITNVTKKSSNVILKVMIIFVVNFVCCFFVYVCIFIVSKALLISSATVIVRAGGAIWLNPFATVLFSVCSGVTV